MSKVFAWINSDLDGTGCAVLLGNMFTKFEYEPIFFGDFENKYNEWIDENVSKYDKIFIIGMPLDQSMINRLDDYKIIFVSDTDDIRLNAYNSTLIKESCTSCSKLLYKKFKPNVEFDLKIKQYIAFVDDYNSYKLKFQESKYINAIYRKSGTRKFNFIVNRFWNGYDGLTNKELKLAESFFNEINNELSGLTLYVGEHMGYKIISTFTNMSVNEIAAGLLENYDHDVIIIVNLSSKFVSFRKRETSKADIKFLAENLCSGGGSENSSGGKITAKFLEFTTKLTQL